VRFSIAERDGGNGWPRRKQIAAIGIVSVGAASSTRRPSGHNIKPTFAADKGGSIPPNLIECGNNESNSRYIKESKSSGRKIHPARFPAELPRFFIQFLTDPGDLVIDPFAGSNTTGAVAERLGRKWIAIEKSREYAMDSELRFIEPEEANGEGQQLLFG